MTEFFRRFFCNSYGVHHWEQWTDEGTVTHFTQRASDPTTKVQDGLSLIQQRKCLLCGMKQARRVKL